jgi:hypothetical protein
MDIRTSLVVSAGVVALAAACGGKTAGVGAGDGGPGSSSSGSSSGSGHGGSTSSGSSGVGVGPGSSSSSSGGPALGCVADDALSCSAGATGFACSAGVDPSSTDPSLICSEPVLSADGQSDYCCADSTSSSSSSSGGVTVPAGCVADANVPCTAPGVVGISCPVTVDPEASDPTLSCSTPTPLLPDANLYCCFAGFASSGTTCQPDDNLTSACSAPTYGYVCAPGDDPTSYDSNLSCSEPIPDVDGVHDDFCCSYD